MDADPHPRRLRRTPDIFSAPRDAYLVAYVVADDLAVLIGRFVS